MGRLVFNADDLGLSLGVNRGIVHCYQHGVVNSASLMTTSNHFQNAVELIEEHKLENIGLHFNLTEGKPALGTHHTLCDLNSEFRRDVHEFTQLNLQEVYNELEAQYKIAVDAGVKINHLDSHHHVHMTARLRKVFVAFAKRHQLPLRRYKNMARNPFRILSFYIDTFGVSYFTKDFSADFYAEDATAITLQRIINKYKGPDLEIMCHPGYEDGENGVYNKERYAELLVLCSEPLRSEIIKFEKRKY